MRIAKLAVMLLALLSASSAPAEDSFKVVANPDVPFDSMSRAQLSDVFLKRTTAWPSGARVDAVDLGEGSSAFEAFCKEIHGKQGSVIRAFWKRVTLSGRDTPPAIRHSDEDVLSFVRATRGAIGYVSGGASTSGVKVIKVAN